MFADIRDTSLFFDVGGPGLIIEGGDVRELPPAIFVHGGPGGDHLTLKTLLGELSDTIQPIYYDQRGQGRSIMDDPARYNLDENVEDLEALRTYLGVGPIVSIGASYGAVVAMAHAARYPDSVSHLVLHAPFSHFGYAARARALVAERGTAEQIAACDDLFAGRVDSVGKYQNYMKVMAPLYSVRIARGGVLQIPTILRPEALNCAHGAGGFLHGFDLRPELGSISASTLIVAGRHDWICAPEFAEELHRLIPDSTLRIFSASSHYIAYDEHDAFVRLVRNFLAGADVREAPRGLSS